jgi:uncharacterized membrane protein (TIGR01666 family)
LALHSYFLPAPARSKTFQSLVKAFIMKTDYVKSYKSFLYSHYLTTGVRITIGVLIPSFLMLYFNRIEDGIIMSLGALFVSGSDVPGAIVHRRNAMLICIGSTVLVTILIGLTASSALLTGIVLTVLCFVFSMLSVYGVRGGAIGLASMLVMVLNLHYRYTSTQVLMNALYILAGGSWYFIFSMLLNRLRPHLLVQQAMGDYLQGMADYLRTRASFYTKDLNHEQAYKELVQQQITVQTQHALVSELIFETREIVKESTHTGRILTMMFVEASDLFDKIMTSYQDYATLHSYFDQTDILLKFHSLAQAMSKDLDEIGLAVKSGRPSIENNQLPEDINKLRSYFQELRRTYLNAENIEGFINLRRILDNVQDISTRMHTLHQYTTFNRKIKRKEKKQVDAENFITPEEITWEKLRDNLTFQSNIFRHSLRVTLAVIAGYVLSMILAIGHSYWILLTVIVILKPAYSLTQQRNKDRLTGTIAGAILGVSIIYLVKNNIALLSLMIFFLAGTNIAIRKHYLTGVFLMTVYVLIFFRLLQPAEFQELLKDRVVDTAIGSVIAYFVAVSIVPDWERRTIRSFVVSIVQENLSYFEVVCKPFVTGEDVETNTLQKARKDTLVSLANLSDAFNRMLSEPKSQRKGVDKVHQLVVLNHRLTSHIATLYHYHESRLTVNEPVNIKRITDEIRLNMMDAVQLLNKEKTEENPLSDKDALQELYEEVNVLLERRRLELRAGELETTTKKTLSELKSIVDQFKFIFKISSDIKKVSAAIEVT